MAGRKREERILPLLFALLPVIFLKYIYIYHRTNYSLVFSCNIPQNHYRNVWGYKRPQTASCFVCKRSQIQPMEFRGICGIHPFYQNDKSSTELSYYKPWPFHRCDAHTKRSKAYTRLLSSYFHTVVPTYKTTPLAKLLKCKIKIIWKQSKQQEKRLAKKTEIQFPFPLALAVYIKVLFTSCLKGHITGNILTNSSNPLSPTLFLDCHNFQSRACWLFK